MKRLLVCVLVLIASACMVPQATPADIVSAPSISTPAGTGTYSGGDYAVYATQANPVGVIVFVHGGGWVGGDTSAFWIPPSIQAQVRRGWVVISVGYHTGTSIGQMVTDVRAATSWGRAYFPGKKVVLAGHSAGGHLSLLAGLTGAQRPDAIVSIAGPTNVKVWAESSPAPQTISTLESVLLCSPLASCVTQAAEVSPVNFVDAGDPPLYLAYGTNDIIVPASQGDELYAVASPTMGDSRVWYDRHTGTHGAQNINQPYLNLFLDKIVDGSLK